MEVLASSDDGQSVLVECSQREGEKVGEWLPLYASGVLARCDSEVIAVLTGGMCPGAAA